MKKSQQASSKPAQPALPSPTPRRAPASLKKDSKPSPETATVPSPTREQQADLFEQAMRLFHRRDFAGARTLFLQAAAGPVVEVGHSAKMHARMCERRLAAEPSLQTPEELYNYGVALLNQGRLREAEEHLRNAIAGKGEAGHFHYAMALCSVLLGDLASAARHLRRAIEIEPGNRIAALNDPDFQRLAGHAMLRDVLGMERTHPG